MKRKLLLVLSVLCMVAAIIIMAVPVMAQNQAILLSKQAVLDANGHTCHITIVVENHATSGQYLTIESLTDDVYHILGGVQSKQFAPPKFQLPAAPAPGYSATFTWDFEMAPGDAGNEVVDYVNASGFFNKDPKATTGLKVSAMVPASIVFPIPELSAGVLFGLGIVGLAGFIMLRRKEAAIKA